MKKISLKWLVLAAGLVALGAQAQERVRIGFMSPITGPQAGYGTDNRDGAALAIKELNAKGVKIGGKPVIFELDVNDDVADPRQGVQVAQALVDKKVRFVLGPYNSGVTMPASRVFSDGGVVVLTVASNPRITQQPNQSNLFRIGATDNQLGAKMAVYAAQDLKVKTVAVIDDRTAYGQGVADEFEKGVKAAGGKVVGREFTNDKATDFTAILTSLKGKKPDVVFFGGMDAVAGPMLRQMKQLGIEAKFMGGDGICTAELPKLSAGTISDSQVVCAEAGGVEGESKKSLDAFKTKFKDKYKVDVQIYAPYVYDAVNVMVDAMVKAKSADPKVYLPVLAKTSDYKGVTGTIAFDAKGDIKNGALTLYTYKGGNREQIAVVR